MREDNRDKGYSYVYTYDNAGNITSKKRYAFTTGTLGTVQQTYSYTYNDSTWKDLLTSYNGTNITYDTIGNPTAIGSRELTWQGRELQSYFDGDYTTTTYNYNADGIRTRKVIYNEDYDEKQIHEYILSGSQIIRETVYLDDVEQYTLVYIYDELGAPIGIKYRTPSYAENVYDCYFFEKNLQGDIVAIYNASGVKIVTYVYDAWGNVTTKITSGTSSKDRNLANNNPFRYRGYYYDTDIGMYYLQSRYYNPEWGRFLNGDGQLNFSLLGFNLFAYCENNPVVFCDYTGRSLIGILGSIAALIILPFVLKSSEKVDDTQFIATEGNLTINGEEAKYYETMEEAVKYWGDRYSVETSVDHKERGAMICSKVINGKKYYYIGCTIKGFETTCWNSFVISYLLYSDSKVGFVHTHTAYPNGDGTWNTIDYGPSDTDKWLFGLPGIYRQFIVDENNRCYEFNINGNQYEVRGIK